MGLKARDRIGAVLLAALVPGVPVRATPPDGARLRSTAAPASPRDTVRRLVEGAQSAAAAAEHGAAARRYAAAAELAPEVAHWLRLSALQQAARAADTAAARRHAEALREEPLVRRDSVRTERARAAFEAGDDARGLELAAALDGGEDPDLWVRHAGPALLETGDTARARRGYRVAAAAPGAPAEAGRMVSRLGGGWEALADVARADLREGRAARGRELLARAVEEAPPRAAPELALELVGARLQAGLGARAHRTARRWLDRGGLTARARARLEILAARSHLRRDQRSAAETHFRRAIRAGGGDASARAAYLLADLAHDRGDRRAARERYRRAAERFPRTRLGGQARMRLGLMDLADGRPERAAAHFRAYRRNRPYGAWSHAALYWEGRARTALGDAAGGRELLHRAVERDPVSYYGQLAAHRLGIDPLAGVLEHERAAAGAAGRRSPAAAPSGAPPGARPRPPERRPSGASLTGGHPPPPTGAAAELLTRMNELRRFGWEHRAVRELESARDRAVDDAGGALSLARRLQEAGWPGQAIGLGWTAFDRRGGVWSRALLETVFPLPHRDAVEAVAARHGVPPVLVAAVIRQESAFDPRAVSRAGAVGLMQLMPETAAQLARDSRRPPPDHEALTDPGLSLALGARYLARFLDRFDGSWPAALIAYNAGPHRYLRWRGYREFREGRELLVERIPFGETRRYVKAVLRNVYLYRRLYGLSGARARGGG